MSRLRRLTVDSDERPVKFCSAMGLPSRRRLGKPRELMTPSMESFLMPLYLVMIGGALGRSAILGIGICCERGGEVFRWGHSL